MGRGGHIVYWTSTTLVELTSSGESWWEVCKTFLDMEVKCYLMFFVTWAHACIPVGSWDFWMLQLPSVILLTTHVSEKVVCFVLVGFCHIKNNDHNSNAVQFAQLMLDAICGLWFLFCWLRPLPFWQYKHFNVLYCGVSFIHFRMRVILSYMSVDLTFLVSNIMKNTRIRF